MKRGTTQLERNTMKGIKSVEDLPGEVTISQPHKHGVARKGFTQIPGCTSKYCPHCFDASGKKITRKRMYTRTSPMEENQINAAFLKRGPRVSAGQQFWNKGLIRWLICPQPHFKWYICTEHAYCPECGKSEVVNENTYARQFGRIRIVLIFFSELSGLNTSAR